MRWKLLLKALWSHHRLATLGLVAALIAATVTISTCLVDTEGVEANDERPARQLLNRAWFDRYPQNSREDVAFTVWLAGGIGIFEEGSVWRTRYEIFEFERSGSNLELRFIQDGEQARTGFTVESCNDQPPFDLCLTIDNPPRGPSRYYSFGDGDDMATHVPWAQNLVDSARRRTEHFPR